MHLCLFWAFEAEQGFLEQEHLHFWLMLQAPTRTMQVHRLVNKDEWLGAQSSFLSLVDFLHDF